MTPEDPRHGSTRGWYAGCRDCEPCRRAYMRYNKAAHARGVQGVTWKMPVLGAQRRIQALRALGWSSRQIAEAAGWADSRKVARVLYGRRSTKPAKWLERKTFDAVCVAYERLHMSSPPEGRYRTNVRNLAVRNGWAPPFAWDDIDDPDEIPKGVRGVAA